MTRQEHLLVILAEECSEVAQRASKALRFGLEEIQPGELSKSTNADRIMHEYADLVAAIEMLQQCGALPIVDLRNRIESKKNQVTKFLSYSRECGTLA